MAVRDEAATSVLSMLVALAIMGLLMSGAVVGIQRVEAPKTVPHETSLRDLADNTLLRLTATTGEPPAWTNPATATSLGLLRSPGGGSLADTTKLQALATAPEATLRAKLGLPDTVGIRVTATWETTGHAVQTSTGPWFVGAAASTESAWLTELAPAYRALAAAERDLAAPERAGAATAFAPTAFDTIGEGALLMEQALVGTANFTAWATDALEPEAIARVGTHWRLYPSLVFTGPNAGTEAFLAVSNPPNTGSVPSAWKFGNIKLTNSPYSATLFLQGVSLQGLDAPSVVLDQIVRGHQQAPVMGVTANVYARTAGGLGAWTLLVKWGEGEGPDADWRVRPAPLPAALQNRTVDIALVLEATCTLPAPAEGCNNNAQGWWIRRAWINGTRDGSPATAWAWEGTISHAPSAILVGSGVNTAGWASTWTVPYMMEVLQTKGTRFVILGPDAGEAPNWLQQIGHAPQPFTGPVAAVDVTHALFQIPNPIDPYALTPTGGYAYATGPGLEAPVKDSAGRAALLRNQTGNVVLSAYGPGPLGREDLFENLVAGALGRVETLAAGGQPASTAQVALATGRLSVANSDGTPSPRHAAVTVQVWWRPP